MNPYDDERLIRAREAMILAVHTFNSTTLKFKTEQFAVQANIAWTYLLHEYYERKDIKIQKNGFSLTLSQMIKRNDSPLSKGIKNNIGSMIDIRNSVEHELLRGSDEVFYALFQANALNFNKTICALFGARLSLQSELAIALQFGKMNLTQLGELQKHDIPEHIKTLDAQLVQHLSKEEVADPEYRFRIIYTLTGSSKSGAHINFVNEKSKEGQILHNVLVKEVLADAKYPYKPGEATRLIKKKSGRGFTVNNHTQAWKRYKVRPKSNTKHPDQTNRKYCIFHESHKDYTYNDDWVAMVAGKIADDAEFKALKKTR